MLQQINNFFRCRRTVSENTENDVHTLFIILSQSVNKRKQIIKCHFSLDILDFFAERNVQNRTYTDPPEQS